MAEINYLDFDLLLERRGRATGRACSRCPAIPAACDFSLPFSDLELENFLLKIGHTRRRRARLESRNVELAKDFGRRLFEATFGDEVRSCLRQSLDMASRSQRDAGLRLRLHLTGAPELADLPWEFLYDPSLNRFFVLSGKTPLVRFLDLPERIRPLAVQPPIRVLAMISTPSGFPPLDAAREWAKLEEAVADLRSQGLVAIERLDQATLAALQHRLRRGEYHIFHFIGHGAFDDRAQDGVLLMEDEDSGGRQVSGQELGMLLHDHTSLRLAILNACEGARASRTDPFAGTAQSLMQQGIPAVIAMQFEVADETAILFAHEFYGAVADGYPVDTALAEARKAIFARGDGLDWGTPVLYMRAPDGRIFDVAAAPRARRNRPGPPQPRRSRGKRSRRSARRRSSRRWSSKHWRPTTGGTGHAQRRCTARFWPSSQTGPGLPPSWPPRPVIKPWKRTMQLPGRLVTRTIGRPRSRSWKLSCRWTPAIGTPRRCWLRRNAGPP